MQWAGNKAGSTTLGRADQIARQLAPPPQAAVSRSFSALPAPPTPPSLLLRSSPSWSALAQVLELWLLLLSLLSVSNEMAHLLVVYTATDRHKQDPLTPLPQTPVFTKPEGSRVREHNERR